MSTTSHEHWMRRCLALARKGELTAAPNPMVGAVIVHTDAAGRSRILGEGYHLRPGEPHAEVHAIRSVRPDDRALLSEATIYVSLEPCAHYGRTPPCSELIIRTGLKRCVVGCVDPFSKVGGRGIEMMRAAGIEVIVGVLREECIYLNRRFFCVNTLHRPFITLKWAASTDGFLDRTRLLDTEGKPIGAPAQLSDERTRMRVHYFRATHQAILVGRRTFDLDLPSLNVRHWPGPSPLRYVLGRVDERALNAGFQAMADIDSLLDALKRDKVQSLFVEGGQATLQSFIERDLWDEAWEECSPVTLGEGIPAPTMPDAFAPTLEQHFGATYRHWVSPVLAAHYVGW
ncbi:MAG: bifunctional diaminohydroxyphosphoribosylaminopyrimidine deaminase/5-amino-6-(5-phosphoribosylamino)uracil reductase RibD [Bacteroidaceae bacterium]|nr:bifunctional diaminohydroxyphosphoribosylaminopyrimidine deaminase/5-amino-6-(5-phosphoribosylamino)uracil reductase RibD [Bacteroidaceae bacterium]